MFKDKLKIQIEENLAVHEVERGDDFRMADDSISSILDGVKEMISESDQDTQLTMAEIEECSPLSAFYTKQSIIDTIAREHFQRSHSEEQLRVVEKLTNDCDLSPEVPTGDFDKIYTFFTISPINPMEFSDEVSAGQARQELSVACNIHKKSYTVKVHLTYGVIGIR